MSHRAIQALWKERNVYAKHREHVYNIAPAYTAEHASEGKSVLTPL
jgi:hypothetical protein